MLRREIGIRVGGNSRNYGRGGRSVVGAFASLLTVLSGTLVAVIAASTPAAAATTYYAKVGGTGTACSPASPCALTEALSKATNGSTVDLAAGTFQPATETSFTIATSITVQPTTPGSTVILERNGASVLMVDATATATVSGLSIVNGSSTLLGGSTYTDGGGIYNVGVLTVLDSAVSDNSGVSQGAIYSSDSLTVEDSTISNNTVGDGGIFNDGGTLIVEDSTLSANEYDGIYNNGGIATVAASTITGTYGYGAAIWVWDATGTAIIEGNTIVGNNWYGISAGANATLAANIIANEGNGDDCAGRPSDAGYNIADDNNCQFSASTSVNNSATIDDYLGSLGSYGGSTQTIPLLATPSPTTGLPDPALRVIPSTFSLPVAVNGQSLACSVPDQRGTIRQQPCDVGAFELAGTTVTFKANGGSGSMAPESGAAPTPLTANAFTNAGYVFAGWNTAADGSATAYSDGATYPFTSSATLYAQWAAMCIPGYYSTSGYAPCTSAPPGTYVSTSGATSATSCAVGTYQPNSGQSSCLAADPGNAVASAGATSETPCAAGTYQPNSGQTSCTPAPPNTYVDTEGATSPTPCPAGTFNPDTGSTSIAACVMVAVANPGDQSDFINTPITALPNSQTNGITPVAWSATGLPAGLTIDPSSGTITGTPTTPCVCSVTLKATDSDGNVGTASFTWTILSFGIATTSLPNATPKTPYGPDGPVTLQAAGLGVSAPGYTTTLKWKKVTLPKGMKLSSAGVLTGTPNKNLAAGPSSVTVKVTETVTTLNGKKKVKTNTTVQATIPLTIV